MYVKTISGTGNGTVVLMQGWGSVGAWGFMLFIYVISLSTFAIDLNVLHCSRYGKLIFKKKGAGGIFTLQLIHFIKSN